MGAGLFTHFQFMPGSFRFAPCGHKPLPWEEDDPCDGALGWPGSTWHALVCAEFRAAHPDYKPGHMVWPFNDSG